jgi:hypothetical protein
MPNRPQSRTLLVHELPGRRRALPPGSLKKPFFGPHGDEHRDPPPNAPAKTSTHGSRERAPRAEPEAEIVGPISSAVLGWCGPGTSRAATALP